jgi:hypothetical protein
MQEYDILDIKAENMSLAAIERERLNVVLKELNSYWIIEETKAKRRSRDRDVVEGDRNTIYFHVVANQRRRKNRLMC